MGQGVVRALFSLMSALAVAWTNCLDAQPVNRTTCDPSRRNQTIFDFSMDNVFKNGTIELDELRGKVTFIVNVATF